MKVSLQDLDGVKLVEDDNFAPDVEVVAMIEGAITQGSQAWGVNRETAVILTLAKRLRDALALAGTVETAVNQLKGEQMARGRLQKQLGTDRRLLSTTLVRFQKLQQEHFDTLAAKGELQRQLDDA